MVRRALLLLPALGVDAADFPSGVVVEAIKYEFDPIGEYCLVPNYGPAVLTNAVSLDTSGTLSMKECADLCTAAESCKSWTYQADTTTAGNHKCWDISPLAPTASGASTPSYGSVSLTYNGATKPMTGIAGSCNCPTNAKAGYGDITGANFPATDPAKYTDMFDSSSHQPAPLGCWPKNELGQLKLAPAVVQRSNQLDSTDAKFFDGWCLGMTKQDSFDAGQNCKDACAQDPMCNGYQWVPDDSDRAPGCFFGAGYDCDNAQTVQLKTDSSTGSAVVTSAPLSASQAGMEAERYTRGYVKVVAKLTKYRVDGLVARFGPDAFTKTVTSDRRLSTEPDWTVITQRCKEICYSDIWCTVWQVYGADVPAGSSRVPGCHTEAMGGLAYPLDRSTMYGPEDGIIDGEFIQHWYSEDITTTTTTTTSPAPPSKLLPILLGLAGLAALLGLGAYAMGWCSPKEKAKKPRAKRALQPAPEPPKEEPRPEPVPTQPSFLMSAPVLTYTAAPVTYAAPVATMQAAPVTYAAPPVTTASYQVVQPQSTVPYSTSVVVPQEPIVGGFMG